jgi:hypothetical protein
MNEKELLENILAADILILIKCHEIHGKLFNSGGGEELRAIQEIKTRRADLILRLQEIP